MKIATYNVNGVNGRLPVLLRWLEETAPDIVCLQELKAPQDKFPEGPIRDAGYGAIWHGQKSWNGVAILARGADPVETRRGLPGDPDDTHSRYIEAAVNGLLVGCLYLPNGNPAPGPKFDYKLRWFDRLAAHAKALLASGAPVVLAGDYNVMPTDLDVYKPERWVDDALFRPEVRDAYRSLVAQGWTDALRTLHPDERIYTFWDYFRNAYGRDAGLRIDHFLLSPAVAQRLKAAASTATCADGKRPAITRPRGSNSRMRSRSRAAPVQFGRAHHAVDHLACIPGDHPTRSTDRLPADSGFNTRLGGDGGIEPIGPVPAIEDGDLAIMVRGDVRSRLHRQHREGFADIGVGAPDTGDTEPGLALLREQPLVLALLLRAVGFVNS